MANSLADTDPLAGTATPTVTALALDAARACSLGFSSAVILNCSDGLEDFLGIRVVLSHAPSVWLNKTQMRRRFSRTLRLCNGSAPKRCTPLRRYPL